MPTISMFYGILVSIYYEDTSRHHRAHIHAHYQGRKPLWLSKTGLSLRARFPPDS